MSPAHFLMQPDYSLAYTLVALCLLLGILVVCIPRPRKIDISEKKKSQ
jgi:hypothetical protein